MSLPEYTFLFSLLDSRQPRTNRKLHIRRLYDVLQLCIQRRDFERATRAWSILARCKEMEWKSLWPIGLVILGHNTSAESSSGSDVEYLRAMMLQHPDEREYILSELVLRLLHSQKPRQALDELELYLPSFPYQDNAALHIYAGLSALDLSISGSEKVANPGLLREAQTHFDHAKALEPDNLVVLADLEKVRM
ncbi:hypothetical protein CPB83DRAFT_888718 [Crepidotus variabilis]|uniref:Uncharacterized protein n=1 Tax=Crepidotus variabilis TaxID=179855 RepID=A0A9P6ETT9_9AGAR|nr:hypothetical protein CPB83DRAFT_888718 [Crepidotus variabilis]